MAAWFHRLGEEEGISLVEMLVSILLMGLVLAALGNTLFTSMAAARQNEGITQATAVGNEGLERLQVASWSSLNPASPPAPYPVTRSARTYTVTPFVSQYHTNYKRYGVAVAWQEDGQPRTLNFEGRRARRPGESNTPTAPINPFRALVFTGNPDPVNLDTQSRTLAATNPTLPGNAAMMIEVELNEAARDTSVIVTWPIPSPTNTLVLSEVSGSNGTKWTGTIASGVTVPAGWMTFRVTAAKAGSTTNCNTTPLPANTNCTESTTAAYMMAPIENGPLYYDDKDTRLYSGTPGPAAGNDRLCLNAANGKLRNSNPFYLGLKGLSADDVVTVVRTDQAGVSFDMAWTKVQTTWWWFGTATSAASGTFTPGVNTTWEVRWTRSYDNLTGTIPLAFHVQNANGNSPC